MGAAASALVLGQPITETSTGEAVQFWILAAIAVVGALGVVASKKAVYSAMFLAMTMIILAIFYIAQGALFLGVVQVVVYTGAVMMLFLFVVMLIGIESSDSLVETLRGHRIAAVAAGLGFGLLLAAGIARAALPTFAGFEEQENNVPALAELLFVRYVWAFELTGVLLIIATLGAMVLAHREKFTSRRTQKEQSQERFQAWQRGEGGHLTPLPSPGVYARHNAVNQLARLPDGSYAQSSVSEVFRKQASSHPELESGEEDSPR
ncbi:NADH-quinone oxidoreductase subunit J [Hoyosella subflava]|uniref:NADH-quinone oxidoreductase subunit J n=1 Tax=Hoyosella subflava (strain DSM 45089 / JCM 17490 / NBRC 109087 / DQS3-9A1) TaxID=443218 RepID=F6EMX6_HOYSD|nr:NADH-quinone oxidoreductase subunit J [Hoyosella subflava]AEF42868.1 NADH-ubiquinone/plastoquinone oxidoreductase chain 6 [Hoyosella subflava DQS3-9A1]